RQFHAHQLLLFSQDRQASLRIGRLHVGNQTPFKTGDQTLLEILYFAGGPVAGENDLLMGFVQRVERVKKLLLDALFARKKLNVIDQENVGLTKLPPKTDELIILNGIDEFIGELLG